MKTLYLDIFSGISGDMFIAALIDLGVDASQLNQEIAKLDLGGYRLVVKRTEKSNIAGVKFDVYLDTPALGHFHPHPHDQPVRRRDKSGSTTQILNASFGKFKAAAEGGGHNHEHAHQPDRNFASICELILRSTLSDWVKEKSIAVFRRIAEAEGKVHGKPPEQVHFHEVGAVDSIVDIVGACIALEMLGKPRVLAANVQEGSGWVKCAHGRFPLPTPATLGILGERGVAISQCDEPHELVTPTGAALLAEFAESFGPMRGMVAEKTGIGIGTRDTITRPNVLRAVLGEMREEAAAAEAGEVEAADSDSSRAGIQHPTPPLREQAANIEHRTSNTQQPTGAEEETMLSSGLGWETDTIAVLETNLDDINSELLGAFVETALAAGALDVFHTPIQMKKNRPGVLLTVLCAEDQADRFTEMLLRETTAFGVRRTLAERRKLPRELVQVATPYGEVTVKLGRLAGEVVQAAPEFESCRAVAERSGVPLKVVYEAAVRSLPGAG